MSKWKIFGVLTAVVAILVGGYVLQQGSFQGQREIALTGEGQPASEETQPFKGFEDVLELEGQFATKIQPLLNSKCVACHSCYNSPCQLDLTSYEGIMRGASPINLYDFPKLEAREPTRIHVDAHSTDAWREKGFYSVVAGGERSVLHRLISELPGIESGVQEKYESEYSRVCMEDFSDESFKEYKEKNPGGRMPFGFPGLSSEEMGLFSKWYADGYTGPKAQTMENIILKHPEFSANVQEWEQFFNGTELKQKLVARYLYEHLFLAHIYFENQPNVFFRLVRSKTLTGSIEEVSTSLPFESPGGEFFYRLRPITQTIAHKSNIPFELSEQKLEKWQKQFFEITWPEQLQKLPEYGLEGSNPFKTFAAIPTSAKYQLFLENSAYFIMTFIKGPVCRGQTALNVINDHFWVLFLDPSKDVLVNDRTTYQKVADQIKFPSLIGDKFSPLVSFREKYWKSVKDKFKGFGKEPLDINDIWNGDKKDSNAAITVYRHYDSATVLKGLRSHEPKTVWVLDYHVFEAIYYNLSAGYNVFGPLLHQLNSRLFMEVSRVASEDLFLTFLPAHKRQGIRHLWNLPAPASEETFAKQFLDFVSSDIKKKLSIKYKYSGGKVKSSFIAQTRNPKTEFLNLVKETRLSQKQYAPDIVEGEYAPLIDKIEKLPSSVINLIPESTIVLLEESDSLWTLIHNNAHYNIGMILFENQRRKPEDDTLSVVRGVATSYPNLIFKVPKNKEKDFVAELETISTKEDVAHLYKTYAISRKDPQFWEIYNHISRLTLQPMTNERGPLDLNRYIMY